MELMNPAAAQESSHSVHITGRGTDSDSFISHLSDALRRVGISTSLNGSRAALLVIVSFIIVKGNDPWRNNFIRIIDQRNVVHLERDSAFCNGDPLTGMDQRATASIEDITTRFIYEFDWRNKVLTDSELLEVVVKHVYGKLYRTEQVGVYSRILEIENLLFKQQRGFRSLGIWGMPGIGKTTLAKAVFNHMSTDYDASCFIKNFDGVFQEEGLHRLLEEKIGKVLKEKFDIKSSYIMRPSLYREKLCDKRILVVLDDVRDSLAAESFLAKLDWFGSGSLIIMTSTDKQVFAFCQMNQIYEVDGLKDHEALQLFYQNAFGKDVIQQNDIELPRKVIDYANGNPLALRIYGQELMRKKSEMESAFFKLKQCPPQKLRDVLENAFSSLDDNEKNIVLDIAFFFKGENVNHVVQMLEGCRYLPRIGIDILVDKCVLTMSENTVQMSNLIQDICQEIFKGGIENCTSLWEPYSIRCLLEDDDLKASGGESSATPKCGLVAEDIESIILDTSNMKFGVKHDAFKNMLNLKFLKIYNSCSKYVPGGPGLNFPKGLDSLPCGLRLLHWENYLLQYLPEDFDLDNLVELCLPYSKIETLWARTKNLKITKRIRFQTPWTGTKNLKMLKRIRLCHSQQLVEIDDLLLDAKNIELIDLQGCTRLKSFPDTSGLQHLRVVNLTGCTEIKSFHGSPPNIEELHLQGTSISEIPISILSCHSPQKTKLDRQKLLSLLENFQDVEHIDLESVTDLVKVSSYNQGFGKLVHLNMKDCSRLRSLPDMVNLESIQVLLLSGCSELEEIKGFPKNLRKLYLGGTAVQEVPQLPKSLELLNAHGCKYLKSVRLEFEKLPRHYIFSNCYNIPPQVIAEFLEKGLTRVASLARARQQEIIKASEFSICIPIGGRQRPYFRLQAGPNVTIDLASWTRKHISGVAMSVVVSFRDDYHNTVGLGIRCTCTWNARNGNFKETERLFHCWAMTEAPKAEWDHLFIFYDTEMNLTGEENPYLWAHEVEFEFETVSWESKASLGDNCKVALCGVEIIMAPTDDTILLPSEITRESEAESATEENHPPTSSRIVGESKSHSPLSSSEPRSKLRSKGSMLWKWVRTIRRDKKKKTSTDREQVAVTQMENLRG